MTVGTLVGLTVGGKAAKKAAQSVGWKVVRSVDLKADSKVGQLVAR